MATVTITQAMIDVYSSNHAKLYINNVIAVDGSVVNTGDNVEFRADSGWEFYKGTGQNTNVSHRSPTGSPVYFKLSADFKVASMKPIGNFGANANTFTVKTQIGAVVLEPIVFTPTQMTLNTLTAASSTMTVNGVPVSIGVVVRRLDVVIVTGNETVVLNGVKFIDGDGNRVNFVGSENTFTLTPTTTDVYDDLSIDFEPAVVIPPEPIAVFTISQLMIDSVSRKNATLYVDGVVAVDGTKFFANSIAKVVALENYTFINDGVSYRDGDGNIVKFTIDGTLRIATSPLIGFDSGFAVDTDLLLPQVKGFNDVFRLSKAQLREITGKRFISSNGKVTTDYGQYILGLIELPFAINNNVVIGTDFVKLGGYNTNILADVLSVDTIKLDMGVINVAPIKDNLLDFKNTIAILHLPYSQSINIDVDYVIGFDISIQYIVNLYDGVVTINISSSKINGVINTSNVDMGVTLPFANLETFPSANDPRSIKLGGDNGIKIPYIEILRNDAILPLGFFTVPISDESKLINQVGFVKIEDVALETNAKNSEKTLIESLLKSGVIIK